MRFAVLAVNIPGNWIGNLSTSCDYSVRVFKCVPSNAKGGRGYLQIDTTPEISSDEVADRIRNANPTCTVQLVNAGPGRHVGTVEIDTCVACKLVADSGCFLDSAISMGNGLVRWNVIAPNAATLKALLDNIESCGCSVSVEKISKLRTARELTKEQERVLQIAYDRGYFEIPRKIKLDSLAASLEVSKATLDVIIRRAQRKVVGNYLGRLV